MLSFTVHQLDQTIGGLTAQKTGREAVSCCLESLDIGGSRVTMQTALNGFAKFAESVGIEDVNEFDADGDYLKPHGARRGVGEAIYRAWHGGSTASVPAR